MHKNLHSQPHSPSLHCTSLCKTLHCHHNHCLSVWLAGCLLPRRLVSIAPALYSPTPSRPVHAIAPALNDGPITLSMQAPALARRSISLPISDARSLAQNTNKSSAGQPSLQIRRRRTATHYKPLRLIRFSAFIHHNIPFDSSSSSSSPSSSYAESGSYQTTPSSFVWTHLLPTYIYLVLGRCIHKSYYNRRRHRSTSSSRVVPCERDKR